MRRRPGQRRQFRSRQAALFPRRNPLRYIYIRIAQKARGPPRIPYLYLGCLRFVAFDNCQLPRAMVDLILQHGTTS